MQDQSVEESNCICKECTEKIDHALTFKVCVVTNLNNDESFIKKIEDSLNSSTDVYSEAKELCFLCKNVVHCTSSLSLSKIVKDDGIMEVFDGHIPELVSNENCL